jgi:hypothetical protein
MMKCENHDNQQKTDQQKALEKLHEAIFNGTAEGSSEDAEAALWQTVLAFQNEPFYTSSGLPFSYTVKCKKNGESGGELLISRKEGSKTLTRSSVMLAFHRILNEIQTEEIVLPDGTVQKRLLPTQYKGPKAIGQIFGISYVYSLFWKWGLIRVPERVEEKLAGKEENA